MKKFLIGLALLLNLTASVSAGPIQANYSDSQLITESGQHFSWHVDAATSTGAGVFEVEAAGDFNFGGSESASAFLDDIFEATGLGLSNADLVITDTVNGHYWKKTFNLSAALMASLTSDNSILVRIENTDPVNPIWDAGFVSWSLTYDALPEPSTLVLAGLGIAGIGYQRRQIKTA